MWGRARYGGGYKVATATGVRSLLGRACESGDMAAVDRATRPVGLSIAYHSVTCVEMVAVAG